MKGFSLKKKKPVARESRELHSRKYWTYLLTLFVLALAGEMVYFSFYFIHMSKVLDAPANPTLETNAEKIKSMQKRLDSAEEIIKGRTGISEESASGEV